MELFSTLLLSSLILCVAEGVKYIQVVVPESTTERAVRPGSLTSRTITEFRLLIYPQFSGAG